MTLLDMPIKGAYIIELDKRSDARGFFARAFCRQEFSQLQLDPDVVQMNVSYNVQKATLRGIHYQLPPKSETKIVRCVRGCAWDVVLDLRKESATFGKWCGAEISSQNRRAVYVPKGFGHAFITLTDDTELMYMTTEFYSPTHERTIRWNDPRFGIEWPLSPEVMSDKDRLAQDFSDDYHLACL